MNEEAQIVHTAPIVLGDTLALYPIMCIELHIMFLYTVMYEWNEEYRELHI